MPQTTKNEGSGSSNKETAKQASTPVRHNYASPHTPIASAKRPRNPNRSSLGNNNNSDAMTPSSDSNINNNTNGRCERISESSALSPMHPARPMHSHDDNVNNNNSIAKDEPYYSNGTHVGVEDDPSLAGTSNECGGNTPTTWGALFSPVLNFLQPCTDGDVDEQEDTDNDNSLLPASEQPQEEAMSADRAAVPATPDGDIGVEVENTTYYDEDGDVSMDMNDEQVAAAMSTKPKPSSPFRSIANTNTHQALSSSHQHHNDANTSASSYIAQPSQAAEHHNNNMSNNKNNDTDTSEAYIEDVEDEDVDEEEEEEFNPYLFIKRLPLYSSVVDTQRQILPPKAPDAPLVTLVLDLDETLVHCTVEPNTPNVDMVFPVVFHGMEYQVHVKKRPHLEEFLKRVYKEFEVVVFTASQRVYADELLDRIDPEKKYIKHRMFRESCLPVEGNYLKDLNVLGRDLRTMVLVDNSPHAFGYQVDNGIPIESWFEDPHDTELLKLELFLRTIKRSKDVRPQVRAKFRTYELIRDA